MPVLGNYDHLFDWVFKQDGSIPFNLAATGIDQMKSVASAGAAEAAGSNGANGSDGANGADDAYGRGVG